MSKLLIVDDSEVLLDVMKNSLESIGYKVKTLISGRNIYSEISEFQPDLLILDIVLDGEDGRHICKELKMNNETKKLCVLLFSSYSKYLKDYKSCYADDFMAKPFDLKILISKIKSILSTVKREALTGTENLIREIISKSCPLHGKHPTVEIHDAGHLDITACCEEFHQQVINIANFMNTVIGKRGPAG